MGGWVAGVGGGLSYSSLLYCPVTSRSDSYEGTEHAENINPLVSGRINVSERPLAVSEQRKKPSRERKQAPRAPETNAALY